MEEQWQSDRATLRQLLRDHPAYSRRQLAEALGRSVAFVKKWYSNRQWWIKQLASSNLIWLGFSEDLALFWQAQGRLFTFGSLFPLPTRAIFSP